MIAGKIRVQISKTSDGMGDYMQAMSDDGVSISVVLVAGRIELRDDRPAPKKGKQESAKERKE